MEKINIVLADTTSSCLKIAIAIEGKNYFFNQKDREMRHLENLVPLMDEGIRAIGQKKGLLNYAGVCQGPGSFTGIRIGIATMQAIAFAGGFSVFGFSVFDVYRYLFRERKKEVIIPVIDAKKKRFYSTFIHDVDEEEYDLSPEQIIKKAKQTNKKIVFAGSDFHLLKKEVECSGLEYSWEYEEGFFAENMLEAAFSFLSEGKMKGPEPIYLRKSEAEIALLEKK